MKLIFPFAALLLAACEAKAPDIEVENGWARATLAGQSSAAAYLTIVNRGRGDDRLVEVSVPRAKHAMLHNSSMTNGVMRMRDANDGVAIPAGASVALAPNGRHIMLKGLASPLRPGEQFPATLRFAKAGTKDVTIKVEDASER